MNTAAAFFIALRYLLGRAKEGGRYLRGAAAGIALSLIPIVVTLIVSDGMIRGITDRYLELGTGHIQIQSYSGLITPEDIYEQIADIPVVKGAWAETHGLGIIVGSGASRGAAVRAIDSAFWEDEGSLQYLEIIDGNPGISGGREVLLGEDLARSINVQAGDNVRIMTVITDTTGRSLPRLQVFSVRGIISSGYRELDSLWCIMDIEAGRNFLPENSNSHLLVKIDDPYNGLNSTIDEIYEKLGSSYAVYTWQQLQRSQYSSYESTKQMLLFIMAIIVIVAAVNVSAATSMLAIERQKDIAVLKTGGASPGFISLIFLFGALITGIIGSVIGLSLGLIIGYNINGIIRFLETVFSYITGFFKGDPLLILESGYYLETIPIIINWGVIAFIAFFTLFSSVLASGIPAAKAGKLKALDIFRKY